MSDTTRAALAQALEALRGSGIVMTRAISAGRIGERYSYIQARDWAMIEATGPINSVNEAITAAEAALAAPQGTTDWKAIARVQSAKLSVALDEPRASERLDAVMRGSDWKDTPAAPARAEPTDAEIYTLIGQTWGHVAPRPSYLAFARAVLALRVVPACAEPTDEQIDPSPEGNS